MVVILHTGGGTLIARSHPREGYNYYITCYPANIRDIGNIVRCCLGNGLNRSVQYLIYVYITAEQTMAAKLFVMQVESGHRTSSGLMEDFCDGRAFAAHPLFSLHSNALQVLFYYDELEVVNPLGSKTKLHKLGMYLYWGLMNFACSYENMFFTYT